MNARTECHELTTRADGFTELAYLGETPWHGLGQSIRYGATIEETAAAAGMNFGISSTPVTYVPYLKTAYGAVASAPQEMPARVALYRDDTGAPLSIVSNRFHVVQPITALEFFRDVVEAGGYVMESAGTMRGGARLFAVVKVANDFELPGGDKVATRLLFATACDGTLATQIKPTTIRVVCRNTCVAALNQAYAGISVRHNTRFDADKIKTRLRALNATFDAFAAAAEVMARTRVDSARAEGFLRALLPAGKTGNVADTRGYKSIMALFDGAAIGADLPSAQGTMWGLLNAVTQYVDHDARARNADSRRESALFGAGDALKARALALATE